MFSRDELRKIYLNYIDDFNLEYDEELERDVYDLYLRQMREETNKKLSDYAQESMITDNIFGLTNGESIERLARNRTDAKITGYFDNLIYEGATDDILKSMAQNNIPTTILRGLKANDNFEYTINGVTVLQEVDKSGDVSIALMGFAIIKDGEYVFQWGNFTELNPNKYLNEQNEYEEQEKSLSFFDKVGTKTEGFNKNEIVQRREVFTSNNIKATQEAYITSTGKIAVRTRINGRFAKL